VIPYNKWSLERIKGLLTYLCAIQIDVKAYFTLLCMQSTSSTSVNHVTYVEVELLRTVGTSRTDVQRPAAIHGKHSAYVISTLYNL